MTVPASSGSPSRCFVPDSAPPTRRTWPGPAARCRLPMGEECSCRLIDPEERLARRIADLYATDPQFADARPIEAISAAIEQPGLRLQQIVRTVMEGYAERPALGQRAVHFVTDPASGRTSSSCCPEFETVTYRELWDRVGAVANALAGGPGHPVRPGDRVSVLGFTSVDYATIDMALIRLGAVCVPLQTSAPVTQLRPIVAETEPTRIRFEHRRSRRRGRTGADRTHPRASSCSTTALRSTTSVKRSKPQAHGWRKPRARSIVETLTELLERGNSLPAAPRRSRRPRRPPVIADLHLGQHRRAEGRDVHRAVGRQLLAQVALVLERTPRRAVDHAQLHADEPRDGPGHPVRNARQRRHSVFHGQERPFDALRGPRAGPAHRTEFRAADLGHAVRRVPERTGPAVLRAVPIARNWKRR